MAVDGLHATEIWRDMIGILHEQVSVKTRRHLLKSYNGVFTGSNAVDVLYGHKQMRPDLFTDNTTRSNIVRLCQRFLESRVFFPAKNDPSPGRYENLKFEDSTTSFYRFNYEGNYLGAPHPSRTPFQDVSNSTNRLNTNQCQQRANSEPDLTRVDCNMSTPDKCQSPYSPSITKHFSFMRKQRTRNLAPPGFNGQVVENMHAKEHIEVFSDDELDSKIERECVRVRLLQLLDLPFVEGFVCSPTANGPSTIACHDRLTTCDLRQFHTVFQSSTDPWIKRAIDVFTHIADAENHLNFIKTFSSNRKRILLFETICNYYTRLQTTLISPQWEEVITAIQSLIITNPDMHVEFRKRKRGMSRSLSASSHMLAAKKGRKTYISEDELADQETSLLGPVVRSSPSTRFAWLKRLRPKMSPRTYKNIKTDENRESSEALQLFLRLLGKHERDELNHLLSFLYIVRVSGNVVLSDRYTNDDVVKMKFTNVIFPTCGNTMLKLCLDRIDNAFSLPENIRRQIATKIKLLRTGRIDSPNVIPDFVFAQQIDGNEFQWQRSEGTNLEVLKLMKNIGSNPTIPVQRKEELISSLQSQHPNAGTSLV